MSSHRKLSALFILCSVICSAQVGINTSNPDPATALDINSQSNSGGFGGLHIGVIQESDKSDITLTAEDDGTMIYVEKANNDRCLEVYSASSDTWGTIYCVTGTPQIIISEYVEGSGDNKFIELYNATSQPISLSPYNLVLLRNGGDFPVTSSDEVISLTGNIPANGTFVIASDAQTAYNGSIDQEVASSRFNFNGNDPVALVDQGNNIIDVVGEPGTDPGTGYNVPGGDTANNTVRRNAGITQPNATWTPSEWSAFPQDDVSNVGQR